MNEPAETSKGKDRQLEAAVKQLMEDTVTAKRPSTL
jgi:hypothetical protein